jgi:hypothetical protein
VPYNRALALRYKCHINVEYCASVRSIKYINKYIYKGGDRGEAVFQRADAGQQAAVGGAPGGAAATGAAAGAGAAGGEAAGPQVINEPKQFMDGRYISASEAFWRILGFRLHRESPSVIRLSIHLPDQQT